MSDAQCIKIEDMPRVAGEEAELKALPWYIGSMICGLTISRPLSDSIRRVQQGDDACYSPRVRYMRAFSPQRDTKFVDPHPLIPGDQLKRCKTDMFQGLEWDNPDRPECTNLLTIYQVSDTI